MPALAGVELQGERVRLGERDCDDYLLGDVDDWLVDALSLLDHEARRGGLIEEAIFELPDELLEEALREAALTLALRGLVATEGFTALRPPSIPLTCAQTCWMVTYRVTRSTPHQAPRTKQTSCR